jgi:hypothetical protein
LSSRQSYICWTEGRELTLAHFLEITEFEEGRSQAHRTLEADRGINFKTGDRTDKPWLIKWPFTEDKSCVNAQKLPCAGMVSDVYNDHSPEKICQIPPIVKSELQPDVLPHLDYEQAKLKYSCGEGSV